MKRTSINFIILAALFLIVACNPKTTPVSYETDTSPVGQQFEEDEDLLELIDPYKDEIEDEMNRVIGYFAHDMHKKSPEGELGNFITDASLYYVRNMLNEKESIDFCMINPGGIRVSHIPQGEVTVNQMFDIMPFENELVIVELSGDTFKEVMAIVASRGGWPISKEANILIENEKIRDFLINGDLVDWDKTYRVLLPDYVVNGGDGIDMLGETKKDFLGIKLRDAMIAYCEILTANNTPITARINGRIIVSE